MQLKYVILVLSLCHIVRPLNNVCKNLDDYWLKTDNCYFNPDQHAEIWALIQSHGYSIETHEVTTQDGYELNVFRIPSNNTNATPVLLVHGIYMGSIGWFTIGNQSLGFVLADNGFDVWLMNMRGTRYSEGHNVFNILQKEYWNYSYHEIGVYDIKSVTDLVWNVTQKQLIYIGYSMGTTVSYVYNIYYPQEAKKKWKHNVSLAPVAFMTFSSAGFAQQQAFMTAFNPVAVLFTNGEFFRRTPETIAAINSTCLQNPPQILKCLIGTEVTVGFDLDQVNYEYYPIYMLQNADAISEKTLEHFHQTIFQKRFQHFDYGPTENMRRYSRIRSPPYDLSKINVNITLFYGSNDRLAAVKDVENLYNHLRGSKQKFLIPYERFTHLDFIAAKNIMDLLYNRLVAYLKAI